MACPYSRCLFVVVCKSSISHLPNVKKKLSKLTYQFPDPYYLRKHVEKIVDNSIINNGT